MKDFRHLLEENERIVKTMKPNKTAWLLGWYVYLGVFVVLAMICFILPSSLSLPESVAIVLVIYGVIFLLLGVLVFLGVLLQFRTFTYYVTNKKIVIESGIIGRDYRVLELSSVTTIDLIVGLADKMCGQELGSLIFYNASNATIISGMNRAFNRQKNGFLHIKNVSEVHHEIKSMIAEIKNGTAFANETANSPAQKQGDVSGEVKGQLLQLKSLVDAGVLTQEEFEQKKKQLLEL